MNMIADVGELLAGRGMGELGQDIFLSGFPDFEGCPDELIVLFDYAGLPSNRLDLRTQQLSLQVNVRSASYGEGLRRACAIQELLQTVGDTDRGYTVLTINGTIYFTFFALQPPFKLKEDARGRIIFAQNFRVHARPA